MSFSVIIPVYNAEQFLLRCLDSVLRQSAADQLEVLAVNDGSTDGSLTILNEYAAAHPFIHVLNQSNQGQAAARNRALRQAQGDWIIFLDADDYWSPDYLEHIVPCLTEQTDVLQTGYTWIPATGQPIQVPCRRKYRFPSAWSKIIRRNFLLEHAVFFPKGAYYDDPVWAVTLWQAKPRIVLSPSTGYCYCQNPQSITANRKPTASLRRQLRQMGLRLYDFGWLRLRLFAHFIKQRL